MGGPFPSELGLTLNGCGVPGPPTGCVYVMGLPFTNMSYGALGKLRPTAEMVTSVPPMYGPVELSTSQISLT